MNRALPWAGVALGLALGACVTINVYFPAAAAEKAADKIIDEVWGPDTQGGSAPASPAQPGTPSSMAADAVHVAAVVVTRVVAVLIPSAAAQVNLEISTPAINAIKESMKNRHVALEPFYDSGAVGVTDKGLVAVRDATVLSLQDRPAVNRLVAEENQDRNALYRAIASANGHPEWEPDIRSTFARRWIDKAKSGWFYESGGTWSKR